MKVFVVFLFSFVSLFATVADTVTGHSETESELAVHLIIEGETEKNLAVLYVDKVAVTELIREKLAVTGVDSLKVAENPYLYLGVNIPITFSVDHASGERYENIQCRLSVMIVSDTQISLSCYEPTSDSPYKNHYEFLEVPSVRPGSDGPIRFVILTQRN